MVYLNTYYNEIYIIKIMAFDRSILQSKSVIKLETKAKTN